MGHHASLQYSHNLPSSLHMRCSSTHPSLARRSRMLVCLFAVLRSVGLANQRSVRHVRVHGRYHLEVHLRLPSAFVKMNWIQHALSHIFTMLVCTRARTRPFIDSSTLFACLIRSTDLCHIWGSCGFAMPGMEVKVFKVTRPTC